MSIRMCRAIARGNCPRFREVPIIREIGEIGDGFRHPGNWGQFPPPRGVAMRGTVDAVTVPDFLSRGNRYTVPIFPRWSPGPKLGAGRVHQRTSTGEAILHHAIAAAANRCGRPVGGFLAAGLQSGDVERLRRHQQTGRPLGSDGFVARLEALTHRAMAPQPPAGAGKRGPFPRAIEHSDVPRNRPR